MYLLRKRLWRELVQLNDRKVADLVDAQQVDSSQPFYGGFPNQHRVFYVGTAAGNANRMVEGLISPKSQYYESKSIELRLNLAINYVLNSQHADGTIDLVSTNFHSPPDTAFVVEPVALALSCVRQHAPDALTTFQKTAREFLRNAGRALVKGGIHTPNHRWVVCAALSRIHDLFPDDQLVDRVNQWLSEKIDIDRDGQYTERSTSVYSPLVNRCLITVARILDRPELLAPVRKNLELTKYFLHANGEIVTEVSRRQDQFRVARPASYYYSYRKMALLDDDGSFAAMTQLIEKTVGREGLVGQLAYFLDDESLKHKLPTPDSLPDNYQRFFPESKCARIRRNRIDATILASNHTFFTFHKGQSAIRGIRLATAFFGKGQFFADSIKYEANRYVLRQKLVGPYYQPLPNELLPDDGNWEDMPRESREQSETQHLTTEVAIAESEGEFKIRFRVYGTDGVPLAIELGFARDGKLTGVTSLKDSTDGFLLNDSGGSFVIGENEIRFGPGRSRHSWTQLRGAEPKLDANSVYIADFTPFDFELTIS